MQMFKNAMTMIQDLTNEAPGINRWGIALNMPQLFGGILFFGQPYSAIIFATNIITVLVAADIHSRHKFSRLTSICHLIWLPLFPLLVVELLQSDNITFYVVWLAYVVTTMGICLILDAMNLWLYFFANDKVFYQAANER